MLVKAFNRFSAKAKLDPLKIANANAGLPGPPGDVSQMINSAGRIGLPLLQRLIHALPRVEFIRFLHAPSLVGSGVHMGTLSAQSSLGGGQMDRTILFEPAEALGESASASESLKHAIYPLVKGAYAVSSSSIFTIGRIDGNDMIMPDYAISKKHAAVEIRRQGYFLQDFGSTNGTMLNGERLQHKPAEIRDQDVVSFARYEFSFLFPESLYDILKAP
jgi:hypothetical protein